MQVRFNKCPRLTSRDKQDKRKLTWAHSPVRSLKTAITILIMFKWSTHRAELWPPLAVVVLRESATTETATSAKVVTAPYLLVRFCSTVRHKYHHPPPLWHYRHVKDTACKYAARRICQRRQCVRKPSRGRGIAISHFVLHSALLGDFAI